MRPGTIVAGALAACATAATGAAVFLAAVYAAVSEERGQFDPLLVDDEVDG